MSADNYWLIRRAPAGRFVAVMGFASDDADPSMRYDREYTTFATAQEALDSVLDDYAEYGHSIDDECRRAPEPHHEWYTLRRAAWLRVEQQIRNDLAMERADNEAIEVALEHAYTGFEMGLDTHTVWTALN